MLMNYKTKGTIICIVLVVILFIFFVMAPHKKINSKKMNIEDKYNDIIKRNFNKISDNYTLKVTLYHNNNEYNLEYMTDGKIKMYMSDTFPKKGYLVYEDKMFYLENNDLHKTSKIEINNVFNSNYYNINFIKKISDKCNITMINYIRKQCILSKEDYIEIYNATFDENIDIDNSVELNVEIIYDDTRIRSIILEYAKDETEKYAINISDINKNDFSEYEVLLKEKYY